MERDFAKIGSRAGAERPAAVLDACAQTVANASPLPVGDLGSASDRERPKGNSISIIIPARDEAPRLRGTVAEVLQAARQQFERYELIIVDDGSTDGTPEVADRLATELPCVRVIHLRRVHGLGGAFKAGLRCAAMEYVTVAHGDGGTPATELVKIWSLREQADVIVPYVLNDRERPAPRLLLSRCFRTLLNAFFGTRLRCYGHFALYRRTLIQSIELRTNGHAFQAEGLVKLLRMGHSFVEVGVRDDFESQAPTRSYELTNVLRVALFFVATLYDVYLVPKTYSVGPEGRAWRPSAAGGEPSRRRARAGAPTVCEPSGISGLKTSPFPHAEWARKTAVDNTVYENSADTANRKR